MTATAGSMLQYRCLMSVARDPADIATLALGGVLSRFQIQGLDTSTLTRLYQRYFYDISRLPDAGTVCRALSPAEFEDLLELLHEHRCNDSEETEWLARAMASACAGQNHLWEDMSLPNRETLSQLIRRYFTTLYYKNTENMRWKKFFYRQLCNRAQVRLCKAPSCGVCSDYALCFGSE